MTDSPTKTTPAGSGSSASAKTILVVDDDKLMRELIVRFLQSAGYRIIEAATVTAARLHWEDSAHKIDMAVIDVMLAGGPAGLRLAEEFSSTRADLPMVFISGYNFDDLPLIDSKIPRPKGRFLQKPFDAAELFAAVRDGLKGK